MKWEFIPISIMMLIPVVAIIGGVISGIMRNLGRQRLAELQQRERIAAIERGLDPSKLPPPLTGEEPGLVLDRASFEIQELRRANGLLIGGLVTMGAGVGLLAFLSTVDPEEGPWAVGLIPIFVGVGLLIASVLVRPRRDRDAVSS